MLSSLGKIIRTVRYLKNIQIIYQLRNRLFPVRIQRNTLTKNFDVNPLRLVPFPFVKQIIGENTTFTFLNLSKQFDRDIDWTFAQHGKLWNYNLHYLDFINQENVDENIRVEHIKSIYAFLDKHPQHIEPYPVSLRAMNLIRFLSNRPDIERHNPEIVRALYNELKYLHRNYEFHLLGNHVLENAFAMLMGSCYFSNLEWRKKAENILESQLKEQILNDGAHFELSPMYHQIIFWRVLEALSYLSTEHPFRELLVGFAVPMRSWLTKISFANGDIPHFNDSADGITFSSNQLLTVADHLKIKEVDLPLSDSGYRKFKSDHFEFVTDINGIKPDYQPGHSHADHLSFVLYVKNQPFIVDPGTSTYNISDRRTWERSTKSHNTVTVKDYDQSEVWGGFRVGRRAQAEVLSEDNSHVKTRLSYRILGQNIVHERKFTRFGNSLTIEDHLNYTDLVVLRLYFHPHVQIKSVSDNGIVFSNGAFITFENVTSILLKKYEFASGFNKLIPSSFVEVGFKGTCKSIITFG